mmetsp:Transcript_32806/g.83287  ORF Transcript_32806/g.83287 Transcript_32806/m.83287 type:complete len:601 (+) Transcript_32806:52-1854(+)
MLLPPDRTRNPRSCRLLGALLRGLALLLGALLLRLIILRIHGCILLVAELADLIGLARRRNGTLAQRLAHVGEETLCLLVLLFLACLSQLQQRPGLLVLRVQFDNLLAIVHAILEILQVQLRLGTPEDRLDVLLVVLEDAVASVLGLGPILQFQVHGGLVQLAGLFQGLRLALILLLVVVDEAESLPNLLILLQCQLIPSSLQELAAHLLARSAKLHFLFLGHVPNLLLFLEFLQLNCEHDLALLHILQAQLCLRRRGSTCRQHRLLALLHLAHGALQGITDLAVAHGELDGRGLEARQGCAGAVGGGGHGERGLDPILGPVEALAFLGLLLHDGAVLAEGHVLGLVDLLQSQGDGRSIRVLLAVGVLLGALQRHTLVLPHARQRHVHGLRQGTQRVRADDVLDAFTLLDHGAIGGLRLQREPDLVAVARLLPALALALERGLNHAFVPEQVVLGGPTDEFHLEDERCIWRDGRWGPALAVAKLRRDRELGHLALQHGGHAEVPALDHLPLAQRKDERLVLLPGGVELRAVGERADVVHRDLVSLFRPLEALGCCDDFLFHALWQNGPVSASVIHASFGVIIHTHATGAHGRHLFVGRHG